LHLLDEVGWRTI